MTENLYVGINDDLYGGMTPTGTLIKDAWVLGVLPETETCKGWNRDRIQGLYDQVSKAWEPYSNMVSLLPQELRDKHARIYDAAVERARPMGWPPSLDDEE